MKQVRVNFENTVGTIKPMHAVNNGPVYKFSADQRVTNMESYKAAGIPYARTHDSSFFNTYGAEHTVDISAIFPDFDKDPYDPASYDFEVTDQYLKTIQLAGTEVFYRLGQKIEHWCKKYNTLPPKDFKKWAVICEHIIKHYNYGWANGFNMNIKYWEIWNEPDLDPDDSTHKRTWGGTKAQFFEFYHIAATHLKNAFPELKIGGPALAHRLDWAKDFIEQLKAPLDFFSWHIYANDPKEVGRKTEAVRKLLDDNGFTETESILNEWNYVKGWTGDDLIYTKKAIKSMKGAAFVASTMCVSQKSSLDMLMYYDARPGGFNGMYNTDLVCDCLKGYYTFKAFNELYMLKNEAESASDGEYYVCAASDKDEAAILVTRFSDEKESEFSKVEVSGLKGVKAEYYLLDDSHDLTLVREETFLGDSFAAVLEFAHDSMYLIKLKKI